MMDRFPKEKIAIFVAIFKCAPIALELNDTDTFGASVSKSIKSA
jgi:hypothetical protein